MTPAAIRVVLVDDHEMLLCAPAPCTWPATTARTSWSPTPRCPASTASAGSAYARDGGTDELAVLTRAERGVATRVAQRKNNREIAAELHLAEGTVKNHVPQLLRKLGVRDRPALALRLSRLGK